MIQLAGVAKRYPHGVEALRDVSLFVAEGEFAFLSGRSGAGKTTLLGLLAGDLAPTAGQLTVAGRVMATLTRAQRPQLRRRIGRLWQDVRLLPHATVRANVLLPLAILGVTGRPARERAMRTLELVGMDRYADSYPSWLSTAEQQRVGIARAIIHEPSILLCDEPTGNLDPESAHSIAQMLLDMRRARGMTVLFATHDHHLIARFHERVILLNKGFLIEDSRASRASRDPREGSA